MIFGQPATQSSRLPFKRPDGFAPPRQIKTGFKTHLNPFWRIMNPMWVQQPHIPAFKTSAQPIGPSANEAGGPSPQVNGFGYFGADAVAAVVTPTPPTVRKRHAHLESGGHDPYAVMRSGRWPGIMPNARNTHGGIQNAGSLIKRLTPFAYRGVNVPAGSYRY